MSAMEKELQRLKKEREVQANSMEEELKKFEEKDGIEIQRLVQENSILQACLFAVEEEAEAKISSMEKELKNLSVAKEEAEGHGGMCLLNPFTQTLRELLKIPSRASELLLDERWDGG
ncbi:hypothetical protein R1flu_023975 [Riccia fluitans]|uniref:Uncharacterized protein n=1 Tax=Riccia fluitans TaxID=41844 RepID=A0ABD1XXM3_9MARC